MTDIDNWKQNTAHHTPEVPVKKSLLSKLGTLMTMAGFWVTGIAAAVMDIDPDIFAPILVGSWLLNMVFAGRLAKNKNLSVFGWVLGSLATMTLSSTILLSRKPKIDKQALLLEQQKRQTVLFEERQILTIAQQNNGFVTPGQVTLAVNITMDVAKKKLDDLVKTGHAQLEISGTGSLKYFFPEFAKEEDPFQ